MRKILTCTLMAIGGVRSRALPSQESSEAPAVEPDAIEALENMGAHLRTLEEFKLTVTNTIDDVVEGGQLVEVAGHDDYEVRRPDRFKVASRPTSRSACSFTTARQSPSFRRRSAFTPFRGSPDDRGDTRYRARNTISSCR